MGRVMVVSVSVVSRVFVWRVLSCLAESMDSAGCHFNTVWKPGDTCESKVELEIEGKLSCYPLEDSGPI